MSLAEIGVVYLYRFAEGEMPVRTFLASYGAHPAGIDHDLHVIFKGFPDRNSLAAARVLFAGLSINPIELNDSGFDIGSYFAAAKVVTNRRLIFFNTFTELLADDWLLKFDKALSLPEVGLVGATGSWQSHRSLYEADIKRSIELLLYRIKHPLEYFKDSRIEAKNVKVREKAQGRDVAPEIQGTQERRKIFQACRTLYNLLRIDRHIRYRYDYTRYPNPHIRTNAFMIERDRFLALEALSFRTKFGAYRFESGRRSLTRQIMEQNLKPIVVDQRGKIYNISEWKSSSTFWIDEQTNLIAADNQTRNYEKGSPELRARLEDNAWVSPSSGAVRG